VKAAVIFNPSSGRSRGAAIASTVEQGLVRRGLEVALHPTQGPRDAMEIARLSALEADVVVAVGGDGTVNEVINGLAAAREAPGGAHAVFGIVPAGTVNVLALELKLPFRVEQACAVIAGGKTTRLDLGRANDRRFVLMMGAGIDALTVRNIDPQTKKRLKELAFVGTGLKQGLSKEAPFFLVRANGREYPATFCVASNCHYYAAHVSITPSASPTDGVLDLMLFTGTTRSSLAAFWLGVPSGLHNRNPHVIHVQAERAQVVPFGGSEEIIWFQTDGELAGELPVNVQIEPQALEILVP
jgi:diacylglycerol kinase (ATP)